MPLTEEQISWIQFARDRRYSRVEKITLLQQLGSLEATIDAVGKPIVTTQTREEINRCRHFVNIEGGCTIHFDSPEYPSLLKHIADPPLVLYALGRIELLESICVSMVGSRRPTHLGELAASTIAEQLASQGFSIVSGLALGIDRQSHLGALKSSNNTIAVLACGVDVIYPARHRQLYNAICDKGLVISEYPLGSLATKYRFPERNRIISGLSRATIIIEAAEKSGTLITAHSALEQNRDVYVVPGSIYSEHYRGSNSLIQQGAYLLRKPEDVLHSLPETSEHFVEQPAPTLTPELQGLLSKIRQEATTIDNLIADTQLTASTVSSMLIELEVLGLVNTIGDGSYIATPRR